MTQIIPTEVFHAPFRRATANENGLSTSERSSENSPALQRWVPGPSKSSPGGTAELLNRHQDSVIPMGLCRSVTSQPSAEALGYFRALFQSAFS